MINFYNEADNLLYKQPNSQFITQDRFRGTVAPVPPELIEEENVTETFGIPATEVFQNGGNNDNYNFNSFNNGLYRANLKPEGYTNYRTDMPGDYLEYLPGKEPEETFRDKIGGYIKAGIGAVVPGGNFLMNMAGKLDNFKNLSGTDKAFIEMQMANQEQNIHGTGNLDNQDRYGYNKRSMKGNYRNVVADRVAIANKRKADDKDLRDIDLYYLEKKKEQEESDKITAANTAARRKDLVTKFKAWDGNYANKGRYIDSGTDGGKTVIDKPHHGDVAHGEGGRFTQPAAPKHHGEVAHGEGGRFNQNDGGAQFDGAPDRATYDRDPTAYSGSFKKGGRVGYFFGGLAVRGMKR